MTFRGIRRKTGTERAPNGQFTGIDMNAVTAKTVATTLALMTPKSIAALRRGETASDPAPRGEGVLQARKLAGGKVVFYFRYTAPSGDRVRIKIGTGLTLKEARAEAAKLSRRYQSGEQDLRAAIAEDEAATAREHEAQVRAEEAASLANESTLGRLLCVYCRTLEASGKASAHSVRAMINRHVFSSPLWIKPAVAFTARDAVSLLHPLVADGKRRQAAKLRSALRAAFHRAAGSHTDASAPEAFRALCVELDPLAALATIDGAIKARDRALTLPELRAYWTRLHSLPDPDGALLRFHLLTGAQRIEQLARATASDLAEDLLILRDGKGRRSEPRRHPVPLLPGALAELERMNGGCGPFAFSVTGGESGATYAVVQHRVRTVAAAMLEAGQTDAAFTPGDLRRTVETRLAAAGIGQDVRARLQSHGLGGVQQRHYDRHDYLDEVRAALETLRSLLIAEPATVTPIRRRRS